MKKKEAKRPVLLRLGAFLLDVMEIYVPAISFLVIFLVFIYQIFSRYMLSAPVSWSFDITMTLYVYAIMLGACYTLREKEHITFSMLYDMAGEKGKLAMRLCGNLLVLSVFILSWPSCFHYAWTIVTSQIKKTSVLFIPYKYLYIPMIFLMADSIVRLGISVIKDIRGIAIKKKEGGVS